MDVEQPKDYAVPRAERRPVDECEGMFIVCWMVAVLWGACLGWFAHVLWGLL